MPPSKKKKKKVEKQDEGNSKITSYSGFTPAGFTLDEELTSPETHKRKSPPSRKTSSSSSSSSDSSEHEEKSKSRSQQHRDRKQAKKKKHEQVNKEATESTSTKNDSPSLKPTIANNHRIRFYEVAYGIDLGGEQGITMEMAAFEKEVLRLIESKDKKVGRETSKRLTPDKLNRRIHALKFWKEGDGTLNKKEFKREYSDCRSLASQGYLVKNHPSTGESLLYKVDPKSHKETRFVDMLETFDIIEMIHLRGCHLKHETNHISILELGFGNITRAECEAYVKTCAYCCQKLTKKPAHKGAAKAIHSTGFRNKFEMDLQSFTEDPQPDASGTLMHYLFVLKDHATRLCILKPIAQKEPDYVQEILQFSLSLIGFPNDILLDNGPEFKGSVEQWLKKVKADGLAQTELRHGPPRTPRVQGSVERLNLDSKGMIAAKVKELRDKEKDPIKKKKITWVTVCSEVMAAINSTVKSRRVDDKHTPYEAVFNMPFHSQLYAGFTPKDIKTLSPQQLSRRIGPNYKRVLKANESSSGGNSVPSVDADLVKVKKENKRSVSVPEEGEKIGEFTAHKTYKISNQNFSRQQQSNTRFPTLCCTVCMPGTEAEPIPIFSESRFARYRNEEDTWVCYTYVTGFTRLIGHLLHQEEFLVLPTMVANQDISDSTLTVPDSTVDYVIGTCFGRSHFVCVLIDLKEKIVTVKDGLSYKLSTWTNQIGHMLQLTGQIPTTSTDFRDKESGDIGGFKVVLDNTSYKQEDSTSCGPIACAHVWSVLSIGAYSVDEKSHATLRKEVADKYLGMVNHFGSDLVHDLVARHHHSTFRGIFVEEGCESDTDIEDNFPERDDDGGQLKNDMNPPHTLPDKEVLEKLDIMDTAVAARQNNQAKKMEAQFKNQLGNIKLGDAVMLVVDQRDRSRSCPLMPIGIVFDVSEGNGLRVVCESGVITKGRSRALYFIPHDKIVPYSVQPVLSPTLYDLQEQVKGNRFDETKHKKSSFPDAHRATTSVDPHGKITCKCRKRGNSTCSNQCPCFRKKVPCQSACACSGGCAQSTKILKGQ